MSSLGGSPFYPPPKKKTKGPKIGSKKLQKGLKANQRINDKKWPAYEYSSLNDDEKEVRVIDILPGKTSSPIEISVHIFPLRNSENFFLYYEALSYAWGDTENKISIQIREPSGDVMHLAVTRNLAEALPHLRLEDKPRRLWIDAISINQNNLHERASQTHKMAEIYLGAENVIVWLGPEKDNSNVTIETLKMIAPKVEVDWTNSTTKPKSGVSEDQKVWSNNSATIEDIFSVTGLSSLDSFLERPWFHRLWIWQEVSSARNISVICGGKAMDCSSFRNSMFSLNFHYTTDRRRALLIYNILSICDIRSNRSFMKIFDATQHSRCTDERDRVYATFGLMNWSDSYLIQIKPDYTKPVPEVYKNFALANYEKSGTVQIMEHCGVQLNKTRAEFTMPSWVPNWSCPLRSHLLPGISCASGSSRAVASLSEHDSNTLNVTGISCATLTEGKQLPFHPTFLTLYQLQQIIIDVARVDVLDKSKSYLSKGNESFLDAFICTLVANNFDRGCTISTIPPLRLEVCLDIISRLVQHQPLSQDDFEEVKKDIASYYVLMQDISCGRSFFTTNEGFIGMAPDVAMSGDIVCIFLGGTKPVLLRPHVNKYQVLGVCYVHGLMSNEAFLVPLPGGFQLSLGLSEPITYSDPESSRCQKDDPRLGTILKGWKIKLLQPDQEFKVRQMFVHEETGEETIFDPRLTPEILKERNHNLKFEVFSLI